MKVRVQQNTVQTRMPFLLKIRNGLSEKRETKTDHQKTLEDLNSMVNLLKELLAIPGIKKSQVSNQILVVQTLDLVVITPTVQVVQQKFAVMRHLLVEITQLTEGGRVMIITMLVQEHMAINNLSLEKA